MKAIFTEAIVGIKGIHRKEDKFYQQYTGIVFNGHCAYDAVVLRLYKTDARHYCCVWVDGKCAWGAPSSSKYRVGSGFVSGYGYHRASAAAYEALKNAGIEFDVDFSGCGDTAIKEALTATMNAMYGDSLCKYITVAEG